jgi:hypothetical protein
MQLLLDRVDDLILQLLGGSTIPLHGDHGGLDGEVRVLGAPELEIRQGAARAAVAAAADSRTARRDIVVGMLPTSCSLMRH